MYKTFTVRFMVANSKVDKQGCAPLYLSIINNKERVMIQLQKRLKPSEFNSKKQVAAIDDVNDYMDIIRTKILSIQTELMANKVPITAARVKEIYNGGEVNKVWGLLELYEKHNVQLKKMVGVSIVEDSYKKHLIVKSHLEKYLNFCEKSISEVNHSFINGFYTFLMTDLKQQNNTAVGCVKKLKKIVNLAFNDGLIDKNPCAQVKLKLDKTEPVYLTEEEIKRIWTRDFSNKRIENVRDVFIFNALTGLAFSDSKALNKSYIQVDENGNSYIKKQRQKTNVMATIPLLPLAIEILEKYDYSLPVPSNQRMNSYLKEIADLCGIYKNLTTHTARHTAATILLNKGVSIASVSAILGHSSLKMTQHYAKLIDKTISDEVHAIKIL